MGYYDERLSAERLRRCYEIAPPRVKQYLEAEVEFVLGKVGPQDDVLELGCGYGRVLGPLCRKAKRVTGIDTSEPSLEQARRLLVQFRNLELKRMDATEMSFRDQCFDAVVCIQNGISAFHVDQRQLLIEAVRVARPGGVALFSSYSEKFWDVRLQWFRLQAEAGLVGPIDWARTGNGVIVCEDGFTATTVGPDRFRRLCSELDVEVQLTEVDDSSLFCEIGRRGD